MISSEQLEEALHFIADNDVRLAILKTDLERAEYSCKRKRAFELEAAEGKSVDDRKAAVERTDGVLEKEMARIEAFGDYEKLKAQMETKQLIIEVWRSVEATRRRETIR